MRGDGLAQLIGRAVGFVQFAVRPPLPVYMGGQTLQYAAIVIGLAAVCAVVSALRASRHSVVTYDRAAVRSDRLVQASGLIFDAALLVVAAYGYYSLKQGTPLIQVGEAGEFLVDPVLLLVPSMFICALALVFRRLLPLLVALVGVCVAPVADAATLLAIRQIYRAPAGYRALVFLVVVTLGLGIFSASAARTLETNYVDRAKYSTPADLQLVENWQFDPDSPTSAFLEPPLSALQVPGVQSLTRTQLYTGKPSVSRASMEGAQVLGVDRGSFGRVSWWRGDFARFPLGKAMNLLATSDNALLASSAFLEQNQLRPGDLIQLSFMAGGMGLQPVEFRIVGSVDYFPTLYPERGPFFIANLDYLHDQLGLGIYTVWLSLEPGVRTPRVLDSIAANGVEIIQVQDQRVVVNLPRLDPQRPGILGLLSLAYIVAALLTVFGFFLHTLLSYQQRTLQLGVLRTLGLPSGGLARMLLLEQLCVVVLGVIAGTVFGVVTSWLFIPFLQIDVDRLGTTPPFVVETAWGDARWICLVLALMLGAGALVILGLIRHMKLSQAIQLGERV